MPHPAVSMPRQSDFLALPESPVVYWIPPKLIEILINSAHVASVSDVRQGIGCADVMKLIRQTNEVSSIKLQQRWRTYVRGGGFLKWTGLEKTYIDWSYYGSRVKNSRSVVPSEQRFFSQGLTYTDVARGSMSVRFMSNDTIFSDGGPGIFAFESSFNNRLCCILNCRLISFILRVTSPSALHFRMGYVANLPLPHNLPQYLESFTHACIHLKRHLIATDPTERSFTGVETDARRLDAVAALLHTLEGLNEAEVFAAYGVEGDDMRAVLEETGTPAGFHPLITGYDALPDLPADLDVPALPQEVIDYLAAHERINPSPAELARIKARLHALYEAGPGARGQGSGVGDQDEDTTGTESDDDEGSAVAGAHIPIPTETFLEELSVKMQIHPISVYWLLEELRREGARCKPEDQRLLEDRLSVLVLRLLGHRWPAERMRDEGGGMMEDTEFADGIAVLHPSSLIPHPSLAERLRTRLRAEDGDLGVQRTEALLAELTGLTLEEWVRRRFFDRHVRQFKYRPVAWHLASTPAASGKGRKSSRRLPAFECMLYYHACGGDVLARIRTQYVEPLLRAERQRAEDARRANDETAAALATERIQELEAFAAKLRQVADEGFACPELDKLLENEPLDRWSGDGYLSPTSRDEMVRQERAWRVDLNDGVRVNIAPVQLAGLLASDVLKAADAKKAIADRARWRSDERRWVREGKLPRCGWMDERVPESQKWTELAPQRAAEQAKLEQKRRAALERKAG